MPDTTITRDWKERMNNLHTMVTGNGNPDRGLINKFAKVEIDLKTNNKLTWTILLLIIGTLIKSFI